MKTVWKALAAATLVVPFLVSTASANQRNIYYWSSQLKAGSQAGDDVDEFRLRTNDFIDGILVGLNLEGLTSAKKCDIVRLFTTIGDNPEVDQFWLVSTNKKFAFRVNITGVLNGNDVDDGYMAVAQGGDFSFVAKRRSTLGADRERIRSWSVDNRLAFVSPLFDIYYVSGDRTDVRVRGLTGIDPFLNNVNIKSTGSGNYWDVTGLGVCGGKTKVGGSLRTDKFLALPDLGMPVVNPL